MGMPQLLSLPAHPLPMCTPCRYMHAGSCTAQSTVQLPGGLHSALHVIQRAWVCTLPAVFWALRSLVEIVGDRQICSCMTRPVPCTSLRPACRSWA